MQEVAITITMLSEHPSFQGKVVIRFGQHVHSLVYTWQNCRIGKAEKMSIRSQQLFSSSLDTVSGSFILESTLLFLTPYAL